MEPDDAHNLNTYRIRVKETLDQHFNSWLEGFSIIEEENGETLLIASFPDQPALRGFLEQLWNLNITVIAVERIENEN